MKRVDKDLVELYERAKAIGYDLMRKKDTKRWLLLGEEEYNYASLDAVEETISRLERNDDGSESI